MFTLTVKQKPGKLLHRIFGNTASVINILKISLIIKSSFCFITRTYLTIVWASKKSKWEKIRRSAPEKIMVVSAGSVAVTPLYDIISNVTECHSISWVLTRYLHNPIYIKDFSDCSAWSSQRPFIRPWCRFVRTDILRRSIKHQHEHEQTRYGEFTCHVKFTCSPVTFLCGVYS